MLADSGMSVPCVVVLNSQTAAGSVPTFTVGLLAGINGTVGSQNGYSSASTFNSPFGVVVDRRGSLIVSDEMNHLIRRVVRDATFEIEYLQVCASRVLECAQGAGVCS